MFQSTEMERTLAASLTAAAGKIQPAGLLAVRGGGAGGTARGARAPLPPPRVQGSPAVSLAGVSRMRSQMTNADGVQSTRENLLSDLFRLLRDCDLGI